MPSLTGIDHVHIYVPDRSQATRWFQTILGLTTDPAYLAWAVDGGPLTISDASGKVHLALFESDDFVPSTATAFGADAQGFLDWKTHLEQKKIAVRCTDHDLAWSLYFKDPYENMYEITTYDHIAVRKVLRD